MRHDRQLVSPVPEREEPKTETFSVSPVYQAPDWLDLSSLQTIKCGKSGVRFIQDTRHAGWIRREAKKRGLKASASRSATASLTSA
jgi:hypothetical protein